MTVSLSLLWGASGHSHCTESELRDPCSKLSPTRFPEGKFTSEPKSSPWDPVAGLGYTSLLSDSEARILNGFIYWCPMSLLSQVGGERGRGLRGTCLQLLSSRSARRMGQPPRPHQEAPGQHFQQAPRGSIPEAPGGGVRSLPPSPLTLPSLIQPSG